MFDTQKPALILLGKIAEDTAVRAFIEAAEEDELQSYARALAALLQAGMQQNFAGYLAQKICRDDNLFARTAYTGEVGEDLRAAFAHDLQVLQALAERADELPAGIAAAVREGFPRIGKGEAGAPFGKDWSAPETVDALAAYFRQKGFGKFIDNRAFYFEGGQLVPVRNAPAVTLADLKDYEEEKRIVEDNIVSFVRGLPYSDMLLYGDKGTGKSSTVHAMLNKYAPQGLRAAELTKEKVGQINEVKELLASLPFRFILFIDDLSLEERDEKVTALKAGLEGSMHEKSANVMIVATSNRRHIVKENFSDRDNSVHARDTMEEQLSLSDRFGLTVCFSSTGKKEYLSIIRQLAADDKIEMDDERLCALAERWALVKGGRSPRRARQFIDYLFSCQAKGTEILI